MSEFAWSAKYSIGNAQIDAEHQRLIELANDVATFAASGEKLPRIKGAIVAEMNATMKASGTAVKPE
ncbi:MAG: hypothetical protein NT087_08580 [Deltaproteobacteria bacterium]|nr:hypothetical protein [Deltaproteobacteria bacterium]